MATTAWTTLPALMGELKRTQERTSGATVVYCFADGVSVLVLRGLPIVVHESRFELRAESGCLWLSLDNAEFGAPEKSWTALRDARAGVRSPFAEVRLPSGDVVLIAPSSHGLA